MLVTLQLCRTFDNIWYFLQHPQIKIIKAHKKCMRIFINDLAFLALCVYGFIALCTEFDSTQKLIFVAIVIFTGLSKSFYNDVL